MGPRALARLAGALGALVLVVGGLWYASRPAVPKNLGPEALSTKAARFEVRGPRGTVILSRSSGIWSVVEPVSYPADAQAVQEALDGLYKARLSEEVSSDASRHSLFELESSSAVRVKVWLAAPGSGKSPGATGSEHDPPVVDFYAGKQGADWDSFFVRFPASPAVFQAEGLSDQALRKEPFEWLDRTLVAAAKADVLRLAVTTGGRRTEVISPAKPAGKAVEPVLDALVRLEADRVEVLSGAPRPFKAEMILEIASKGGKAVTLRIGPKGPDGTRPVDKAGEPKVRFRLSDWRLEPFRKAG